MKKWFIKPCPKNFKEICAKFRDIHPVLIRLMLNRKIAPKDFRSFLRPTFETVEHDPFLMADMDKAVNLIMKALNQNQKIRICGDYDQDGNSAILTLYDGLLLHTENVDYDIPDRVEDGYGLSVRMVDQAHDDGIACLITCDNGVQAFEAIEQAKKYGMTVIVTDHHQLKRENDKDVLPLADAVVNPQREDCGYPFKSLCGAGVAYKLVQALYRKIKPDEEYLRALLEYVAMGTVCDIVDLVDENRLYVIEGLKCLNHTGNYGLQALIRETGLKTAVNTYALGYILGPCINATGRLDSAKRAAELLIEEDMDKIDRYAKELVQLNEERKKLTEEGCARVFQQIEEQKKDRHTVIVAVDELSHESVAGIIAGRVKERYHRPVIVLTASKDPGIYKGSGRSVEGYPMHKALAEVEEHLLSFGGHAMAAGVKIKAENVAAFEQALEKNSPLTLDDCVPQFVADSVLYAHEIDDDLMEALARMEPYGKGNSKPLFADKRAKVIHFSVIGKEENIIKMRVDCRGRQFNTIKFRAEKDIENLKEALGPMRFAKWIVGGETVFIDMMYSPQYNDFRGERTIQLVLEDFRLSEEQ